MVAPPGASYPDFVINSPSSIEPLVIRDVKGLDPVINTVNSYPYGKLDGEFFTGTHMGKRNIVLTLGLNTDDPATARKDVFFNFVPKTIKKLRFVFDNRASVEIDGYIESTTGDRFVEDPEIQISIICPKPNLLTIPAVLISGSTGDTPVAFTYNGSAPGTIDFELLTGANAYTGDVFIESKLQSESIYKVMHLEALTLVANSELSVITHQGLKNAQIIPLTGNPESVVKNLNELWYWKVFHAGAYHFRVRTPGDAVIRNWNLLYVNQEIGVE